MLVVVGGGFAGLETAIQIRSLRPSCELSLVSPRPSLVYKPWLIYLPAGRRRFADICMPLRPMATHHGLRPIEGSVDRVDVDAKQIYLAGGELIDYSELMLATGAEADRGRISGAGAHAFFPCDPNDTEKVASATQARKPRVACVAVGWEWPRPECSRNMAS